MKHGERVYDHIILLPPKSKGGCKVNWDARISLTQA